MHIIFCLILLTTLPLNAQTPSDQYQGFTGYWLKNDRAEAFAIASPYPRVLVFRLKGGENPLHVSREYEYIGIRTWFFEPIQIPQSGLPALRPATGERTGERSLRLSAAPDDSSGLQLTMELSLDPQRPVLKIRHGFKNLRREQRRIAAWALNVIRPDLGVGVTPWRTGGRRNFLFWADTDPNEIGIHLGPKTLALDYRIEPQNRWQKIGTNGNAGWIAYVWNENALKSTVAHVANAEYPEDGGTVTMFNSTSEVFDPRFGEIENIGPLSELMPGNTLWMEQELELFSGIEADDPESWIEILGGADPQ
ncbi:MAG: hypothetical protein VX293_01220 [Candidatus Latescibacterota bacterium]|nr:hypothetical protein [Candidatus Latescibacterota bacterium]